MSRAVPSARRVAGSLSAVVVGIGLAGCSAGQITQTSNQHSTVDGATAKIGDIELSDITVSYPDDGLWEPGESPELHFTVTSTAHQADTLQQITTDAATAVNIESASVADVSPEPTTTTESAEDTAAASGAEGTGAESTGESAGESAGASTAESAGATGAEGTSEPGASSAAPSSAAASSAAAPTVTLDIPAQGFVRVPNDDVEANLDGLKDDLRPTQVVPITFVFANAGSVTVQVPVANPSTDVERSDAYDFNSEEHSEP